MTASITCHGCGAGVPLRAAPPWPFRCPSIVAGDDVDHVLVPRVDASWWPVAPESGPENAAQPFVRYRRRLVSWHLAQALGLDDSGFVRIVRELDESVARVDGRGFRPTPLRRCDALSRALSFGAGGGVLVKDETGNVSGSHKARHLFGIMLVLRVLDDVAARHAGARDAATREALIRLASMPLAIASCGNAALAAAVVARAADRRLDVFIPPSASPAVVSRLQELGATIAVCERRAGESGDPCYTAFRAALDTGAVPFCCQGPDNGLTIEGGETLGDEVIDALEGAAVDRVFVQVGGGALATSCIRAFTRAWEAGAIARLPRVHAVQTEGGSPLARAYERVAARALDACARRGAAGDGERARADRLCTSARHAVVRDVLRYAATHRHEFMWPWAEEPRSIAHGILDDETYDWHAVVEGMIVSGGWPLVVGEDDLRRANRLARERTGVAVDHTGSAGLAGLLHLQERGGIDPGEQVLVIFSGVDRGR